MKVALEYTSTYKELGDKLPVKEGIYILNSLEELIDLQRACKHPFIIDTFCENDEDFRIEVYNTYRE